MAISITAENYPALSASAVGVSGKRYTCYVSYGTGATATVPKWVLLGGLRNSSITYNAEVNQVSVKDSSYWNEGVIVNKSAEVSLEMILKREDLGQKIVENFIMDDSITSSKHALNICIVDLDDKSYTVLWVCPTSWEVTADAEDFVQVSCSATVIGAPEQKTGFTVS